MKKNISLKKLRLSKKTVSDLSALSGGFQLSETFEPNCETSPVICFFPVSRDQNVCEFP
ncbi:hypothetical protein [Ascidiimonas aurantiaca]|uniref:hypothetical protein n=1 Tax=Ascidiimonas aurantiaca TaxID=1685432 RepID=UPI0030EE7085